jgi:hypothetical protein
VHLPRSFSATAPPSPTLCQPHLRSS